MAESSTTAVTTTLNYQQLPPPGKRTGRYIGDTTPADGSGDLQDVHEQTRVQIRSARGIEASLGREGFELRSSPSSCTDYRDAEMVRGAFYTETRDLVRAATGADRVVVFDHTLRLSAGAGSLNSLDGAPAAPVTRVHCDYTAKSAPVRFQRLMEEGIVEGKDGEKGALPQRFSFINVWRNIAKEPVMKSPLAVCATSSVNLEAEAWPYVMVYPDRVGENMALANTSSADHAWYFYPQMTAEEALLFTNYDSREDGPRFVFHTAFEDPSTPASAPERQSVEVRTVAIWD